MKAHPESRRPDDLLERYTSPFREFGWLGGLLYAADRALSRVLPFVRVYCYDLMMQPVPDAELLARRHRQRLMLREIRNGDPEVDLMPALDHIKKTRFAQHAVCLGAFRGETFVGYIWFSFRRHEEDEVRCTYELSPPGEAVFDFDLYIFPAHRMGLAFAGIWNEANRYLRSRGIRHSYSRLTRFNLPSRRAHAQLGAKRIGSAVFLRAGPLEMMAATVPPYLHVSLRRSHRVRLRLHPPPSDRARCGIPAAHAGRP